MPPIDSDCNAIRAGYAEAPRLWEKMLAATGTKGQSDFLSTHPQSEKRQAALESMIAAMMPYYQDTSPRPKHRLGKT